jgi:hypothetical protein
MKNGLEGNSEMADEPNGASDDSKTQADQRAEAPDLAAEREALWEASALSPEGSVSETNLSPGVRAALEQIFPAEEPRLGRVAEQSAVYDAGATGGADEGIEALAGRYGITLETLAARLDLSAEVLRAPCSDCPPALLVAVTRALAAPMAEVALALHADDDGSQEPDDERSFAERVRMAPSLSEEQRHHWLALLATDPA